LGKNAAIADEIRENVRATVYQHSKARRSARAAAKEVNSGE